MTSVAQHFAPSYAEARRKFLQACLATDLKVEARSRPSVGVDGEDLSMDVALDGPADARRLLVVSSGCHGIEGHGGSGIQVAALHDADFRRQAAAAGVAVLYVHAINPHGFSHGRRVTVENVDLNRNFVDFAQPLPVNKPYAKLDALLLPEVWPPPAGNETRLMARIAKMGIAAFQSAVSRGQHAFPDGLFFGGTEPTRSHVALRELLAEKGAAARQIAWIDLHTGLGPTGVGERMYSGASDDHNAIKRARAWWGREGAPVTLTHDGSSSSAALTGEMRVALPQACLHAEVTALTLEFGTVPILQVMAALRADHWLHRHPDASPDLAATIRQQMRDAFYCDTDEWKRQLVQQGVEVMGQAVDGLGRD